MNHLKSLAVAASLLAAHSASAQDGFYYGLSFGFLGAESSAEATPDILTSANDFSLGAVVGYEFASTGQWSFGVEGTLDLLTGETFTYDDLGRDSCSSTSPDWCSVDTIVRVRGVADYDLGTGSTLLLSAGFAAATGVAEDGPFNYADTTGTGYTIGLGVESDVFSLPLRVELVYDMIDSVDPDNYEKELEIYSLRASYFF